MLRVVSGLQNVHLGLGRTDLSRGIYVHEIGDVVIHDKYTGSNIESPYDIAILKLNRINYNDTALPICLQTPRSASEDSVRYDFGYQTCYISGWGETENGDPPNLQEDALPILSGAKCQKAYDDPIEGVKFNSDLQLCGGVPNKVKNKASGPCKGDSGGPLACTRDNVIYKLEGIISSGSLICMRHPAILTRVTNSDINRWIRITAIDKFGETLPRPPTSAWLFRALSTKLIAPSKKPDRKMCSEQCARGDFKMEVNTYVRSKILGDPLHQTFSISWNSNRRTQYNSTTMILNDATVQQCINRCCSLCPDCEAVQYDIRRRQCVLLTAGVCHSDERQISRLPTPPGQLPITHHYSIGRCRTPVDDRLDAASFEELDSLENIFRNRGR